MRRLVLMCAMLSIPWMAESAQPTLTMSSFTIADTSNEDIAVTMTAGQSVAIIYMKMGAANRTVAITDDSGSNSYPLAIGTGNCATTRCVEAYIDYAVSGGTFTVTVDQSSTFINYRVWIVQFTCASSCSADSTSFFLNTSTTSHVSSADATVIDTSANTTLVSACVSTSAMGTTTPGAGWEALSGESDSEVFGQFEDDIATAFADERGAWTSGTTISPSCVIFGVADDPGGGGAGAGGGSGRLTLLGVG